MTPQFNIFPRSEVLPQNISFFSDFDSELRKNGEFWGKVCSLEVATNFEKLQFTSSSLVVAGCRSRDTG
jgi:hypothetical protein